MFFFSIYPDALFLDLDGTLADSHGCLENIYHQFLEKWGKKGTTDEFKRLDGPTIEEVVKNLFKSYGLDSQQVTQAVDEYRELLFRQYLEKTTLFEGVDEFLKAAKKRGIPLFLVTSAPRLLAEKFLVQAGIRPFFTELITKENVTRSKPSPDIYIKALHVSGKKSCRVLALEDGSAGIKSASSAGIPTYQVNPKPLFPSLEEVLEFWREGTFKEELMPLPEAVSISILPTVLPEDITFTGTVKNLWDRKTKENPKLFDGRVFRVVSLDENQIEGQFCPYSIAVATSNDTTLNNIYPVYRLAVSGRVFSSEGMLIGKRSGNMTQYPGYFELVPSGGVDDRFAKEGILDLKASLLQEWEEETQMDLSWIQEIKERYIYLDKLEKTFDVVFDIFLKEDKPSLRESTDEYSEFLYIKKEEIPSFLVTQSVLPLTRKLLEDAITEC